MWRAFVYDANVDPDRVKRAYMEFVPLDGAFRANVLVQVKNGPLDFSRASRSTRCSARCRRRRSWRSCRSRRSISATPRTSSTWRRCGRSSSTRDTYAKGPGSTVAKVVDGTLHGHALTGIAGVANTGSDRNWTGHDFAAGELVCLRPPGLGSGADVARPSPTSGSRMTWEPRPDVVAAIARA